MRNLDRLIAPVLRALQPSAPPRLKPEKDISEAQVQKQVLAHLTQLAPHAFFWRANTGGAQTQHQRQDGSVAHGHITFGLPGQPDIMGTAAGLAVGIETKRKGGKQRATQVAWQARWEAAGGVYILATNVDEALVPIRALLASR